MFEWVDEKDGWLLTFSNKVPVATVCYNACRPKGSTGNEYAVNFFLPRMGKCTYAPTIEDARLLAEIHVNKWLEKSGLTWEEKTNANKE